MGTEVDVKKAEFKQKKKPKSSEITLSSDTLFQWIAEGSPAGKFLKYNQWLDSHSSQKPAALSYTLQQINEAIRNTHSLIYSNNFSLQTLRLFVAQLVKLFAEHEKQLVKALTENRDTPPQSLVNTTNFACAAIFLQELTQLLTSLQKIPLFHEATAPVMWVGSLLRELAEFVHLAKIPAPKDFQEKLPLNDLLHIWLSYDKKNMNAVVLGRAIEATGLFAKNNFLTSKKININPFLHYIPETLPKQNSSSAQEWLFGIGLLAEKWLLSAFLDAEYVNRLLSLLAKVDSKYSLKIQRGYSGFIKLLRSWQISKTELILHEPIHTIFKKFFSMGSIGVDPLAHMTHNLAITKDFLPTFTISFDMLNNALNNITPDIYHSRKIEHAYPLCQFILSLGQLVRSQVLYADITDEFVAKIEKLFSVLAIIIKDNLKDNNTEWKPLVDVIINALYGRSLLGISNRSVACEELKNRMLNYLSHFYATNNIDDQASAFRFSLFLTLTQPTTEKLPSFITAQLEKAKPSPPRPGTIQAQVAAGLAKEGCIVQTEGTALNCFVDLLVTDINGRQVIGEINGWGHHFRNPIKGDTKDLFKSYLLESKGITVYYFDFTKQFHKPEDIVQTLLLGLKLADTARDEKKKKGSPQQLYQFIRERIGRNPEHWQQGLGKSKVAVGTSPLPAPDMKETLASTPHVPLDRTKIKKAKKASISEEIPPNTTYVPIDWPEIKEAKKTPIFSEEEHDIPKVQQIIDAAKSGDISLIQKCILRHPKGPINPYSHQPDRYGFAIALMAAMQEEQELTGDNPKKRGLFSVIKSLVDHIAKSFLTLERLSYSPLILAKKGEKENPKTLQIICNRLQHGTKKKRAPKIDWQDIQNKANQLKPLTIEALLKLSATEHDQTEQKKNSPSISVPPVQPLSESTVQENAKKNKPISSMSESLLNPYFIVSLTPAKINQLHHFAHQGDPIAQFYLGMLYLTKITKLIEKDIPTAIKWLSLSAEQKFDQARCALGLCYNLGIGVEKDAKKAVRFLQLAAEKGNSLAHFVLGDCYLYGDGVEKDTKEAIRLYRLADDYPIAQHALGRCYLNGEGVEKDAKEAVRLYRLAADQEFTLAQYALGNCYLQGEGVEKDAKEAVRLHRLAAEQEYSFAQYALGNCYLYGNGVERDVKEALRLYRLAADQGFVDAQCILGTYRTSSEVEKDLPKAIQYVTAQFELGLAYATGKGVKKDIKEAVRYYQLAAKQNDASAQYYLAYHYLSGEIVGKSAKDAVPIFKLAAEQGHARAQYMLGVCYELGQGIEQNEEKAIELYQSAAKQGHSRAVSKLMKWGVYSKQNNRIQEDPKEVAESISMETEPSDAPAQFELGFNYEHGKGVEKDIKKAVRFYKLAAEQGFSPAQNNLGHCYCHGKGIEKDVKEAIRFYKLAAEQGFSPAQSNLGYCYQHGKGLEKDVKEAIRLYNLAIEQGNCDARNNLAFCYLLGEGGKQDIPKALELYFKSAKQGSSLATSCLALAYIHGFGIRQDLTLGSTLLAQAAEQGDAYAAALFVNIKAGKVKDIKDALHLYTSIQASGYSPIQLKLDKDHEASLSNTQGDIKKTQPRLESKKPKKPKKPKGTKMGFFSSSTEMPTSKELTHTSPTPLAEQPTKGPA